LLRVIHEGKQAVGALLLMAAALAGACAVGNVAVGRLRRWLLARQIMDVPGQRSSHSEPTPRGGGLVFFPVIALAVGGYLLVFDPHFGAGWIFVLLTAAIGILSWLDDVRNIPAAVRLVVQVLVAVAAVVFIGSWTSVAFPVAGTVALKAAGPAITALWIVGLTNAYNFMDGIDGIAATQAVLAGLGWAALGLLAGWPLVGLVGAVTAGVCLGFLVHNLPPARIFMGDVGSAVLGFTFAILPLLSGSMDPRLPWLALLFVWPFVFDTALTFARRLAAGENVMEAHRDHLYQRLVRCGWSHGAVTVLYGALALAGVAVGIAWWSGLAPGWTAVAIPAGALAGLLALVSRVISAQGRAAAEVPPR
jgi:UDP-N-acetylmuramyl pentapeptide phosphotransferase/UDP-N-acetylglucosamine-1-phosphate transferase